MTADTLEMAAQIEAEHVALGIARASQPERVGAAGDCDDCGHYMPRLVDGLCGFCRDGRLPPDNWVPPVRPANLSPKEPVMPAKTIMLPAAEAVAIKAVEDRAKELGSTIGIAAADLIVAGWQVIKAENAPGPLDLGSVHFDALLGELRHRLDRSVDVSAIEALTARAEDAEAKLAGIRAAIG